MIELPIGTRVLLIRTHPYAGRTGTIIAGLRPPSIGILDPMYTVRLDGDNHEIMAGRDDLQATTKRRLPPMEPGGTPLFGPNVKSFTVGSWCPTPDGSGPALAVGLSIELDNGNHIVFRLKTPERVDEFIQMLLRHKRDVWPNAK